MDFTNTRTLLGVVEQNYPPSTTLVDTFFPNENVFMTNVVDVEYRKGVRTLAPYIVPGASGVNVARNGSTIKTYTPPMTAPKRVITPEHLNMRSFGETVYSPKSPAQRAAELMARDLMELTEMNMRRQEYMAAQLLTTGQCVCEGYADDGKTKITDTFILDGFKNKVTKSSGDTWDNADSKIYEDIEEMSGTIADETGTVPTVAFMSRNVGKYLLNNTQIKEFLNVSNAANLKLMSFAPRVMGPNITRFGYIDSLDLEIYIYNGSYMSDDGKLTKFIPDDFFIMGNPGKGKRLYGAITQLEDDKQWHSYASKYVPKVYTNVNSDVKELRVASRCIMIPENVDDIGVIKVKS